MTSFPPATKRHSTHLQSPSHPPCAAPALVPRIALFLVDNTSDNAAYVNLAARGRTAAPFFYFPSPSKTFPSTIFSSMNYSPLLPYGGVCHSTALFHGSGQLLQQQPVCMHAKRRSNINRMQDRFISLQSLGCRSWRCPFSFPQKQNGHDPPHDYYNTEPLPAWWRERPHGALELIGYAWFVMQRTASFFIAPSDVYYT
jgi:hypothetical protein